MLRIERAPPPRNKSAPPLATGVPLGSHLPSPASPQILHGHGLPDLVSALSEIGVDFQKDGSAREITKNRARFLHPKPACHSERCRQPASPGLPATMHPRPFQFQRGSFA